MGPICTLHEFRLSSFAIVDQNEIDGNNLLITYSLHNQGKVIKSHTLIDCGATSYAIIDEDYVHFHHLPLHLLKSLRNLAVIDGKPVTSGVITHITHICHVIRNHQKDMPSFVTKLQHYQIV
jgi:predicted aspartyl protease